MGNLSNVNKSDILPEFQTFLLDKKMVPEKNVFFYALWTSKFFTYARKKQISSDQYQETTVIEFIEVLKSDPNMSDWQIRQAQGEKGSRRTKRGQVLRYNKLSWAFGVAFGVGPC
jgi:hypothetical protein